MPRSTLTRRPRSGPERLAAVVGPRATRSEPSSYSGRDAPSGGGRQIAGRVPADPDPPTVPLPVSLPRRRVVAVIARLLPAGLRTARFDPGRAGALALAMVAATAAVVAAASVWFARPQAQAVAALPPVTVTGSVAPSADPAAPPGPLVVSVSGRVARPGLVRVPDGARIADVLAAAGGALPGTDLAGLNLARKVADGEQVVVGAAPAAASAPPSAAAGADPSATAGPIDLNTASVAQLDALPGVGPVTAQRIVDWRTRNGRFARVDQLREVPGIGEHKFEQLRSLVRV